MTTFAAPPTIDGVTPHERAAPETAEELAGILHQADVDGQAVVPLGGGSQLDLGMPPTRADLALDTTALTRVVEYEPADLTVTVEAGMRFAELQSLLGAQGQLLALDPPVAAEATIGGVIATNASGPLRYAHGTARDLVIGTRVANPDGTLTRAGGRVVKNVAGYDLNKLYVGSLGTLGVIVELSFKLAPVPPALATLVGRFDDLDDLRAAVRTVVHSPLAPLAIEVLGPRSALAVGLPAETLLLFRVGGYPRAVERQLRDLGALVGAQVETPETVWDDLTASRRAAAQRSVVVKASAPLAESVTLVALLERALGAAGVMVWAHAGNGVAYAACESPVDAEVLIRLREDVRRLGDNAALVVQRCPAEIKPLIDVWGDPGPSIGLMRALKAQLDPHNTLNPGRYVGGI